MSLVVLASLLFLQVPAAPPACPTGQLVVDEAGHCCLPGGSCTSEGCVRPPASRFSPPPMPVPVRFTAASPEDAYDVAIAESELPGCTTPCELRLLPSRYRLEISGSARFRQRLHVPEAPLDLRIERRDELWKDIGIASVAVGGGALLAGAGYSFFVLMFSSMGDPDPSLPRDPYWARRRNEKLLAGAGVATLGVVLAGTGGIVGFRNAGHTRVVEVPTQLAERDEARLELVALAVEPAAHGAHVGASFRF